MQEIKKKNGGGGGNEDSKKKERHIVTWTQEEDDILREQISLHGTENWAIIASKFKDKTTRQCRRRWYTYLNSDFKKGGWSPEEDMLLCEAQKIFGNRWTEIAKVVSGRTDNAVKNRFSTLCKKRAKYEALAKEKTTSCINPNNKRILLQNGFNTDGTTEFTAPIKRMRRSHISDLSGNCNFGDREHRVSETIINQQLRYPFSVLGQHLHNVNNVVVQSQVNDVKVSNDGKSPQATKSWHWHLYFSCSISYQTENAEEHPFCLNKHGNESHPFFPFSLSHQNCLISDVLVRTVFPEKKSVGTLIKEDHGGWGWGRG